MSLFFAFVFTSILQVTPGADTSNALTSAPLPVRGLPALPVPGLFHPLGTASDFLLAPLHLNDNITKCLDDHDIDMVIVTVMIDIGQLIILIDLIFS